MINKLSYINNLAVFKNFEWDKHVLDFQYQRPISFKKVNILYGRNYSGKTTLSRIFRSMETSIISDKYDNNPTFTVEFGDGSFYTQKDLGSYKKNIRVFNDDFVRDNLKFIIDPDENIKPFAVLGDNNNILEAQIASLENEIGSNENGKETGLYSQYKIWEQHYNDSKSLLDNAENNLDRQITEKATDRNIGIKYKPERFGDQNYNKTKLDSDIKIVLSDKYIELNEKELKSFEDILKEQEKKDILPLSTFKLSWDEFCNQAEQLIEKKIGVSDKILELIHDAALNKWVKEGYTFHKDKRSTCAFCGNQIEDGRWDILYRHFDEESKLLEDSITSLIIKINTESELVKNGLKIDKSLLYSKYHEQAERITQSYRVLSEKYIDQLDLIKQQLNKRLMSITVPFNFVYPQDYSNSISNLVIEFEDLFRKSNSFTAKLSEEKNKAKYALRLKEVSDFVANIGYVNTCSNIELLKNETNKKLTKKNEIRNSIEEKLKQIDALKRKMNDEEKGALKVNDYLIKFFGYNYLSLQSSENIENGKKKIHFEIVRDGKHAYHLSEGECSLIAFCYFMAKLEDIETKDTKPIIWIDDPISSLDGNHIFFIYSLIATQICDKDNFEQLFISTHSLDFLKYLRRLNAKNLTTDKNYEKAYFHITRNGINSCIQQMPKYMKEYATEFNYLFQEIYKCSCIDSIDDANYSSIYNFGNNARKFLEIYLFYKYPDSTDEQLKLEWFFGNGRVPAIFTERINNEYSHGDIERASLPIEVPEMKIVAKMIVDKIKEDERQYVAFMNSIGVAVTES